MTYDPEDRALDRIHAQRLVTRDIDQLLGICECALIDGHIDQGEAESIYGWLKLHQEILDTWPASVLYDRLRGMLSDSALDADEQGELLSLFMQISFPRHEDGHRQPSSLPLSLPASPIQFPKRTFCFTGVFNFGSRTECQAATEAIGGVSAPRVTKKLDYLVIGTVGSDSWRHTSFGSKILKAVEYRDAGNSICIISEEQWALSLEALRHE